MDAVTAALAGLVDYAGLFPPAGLPLDEVVDRYGRYRAGRHAWMLGRLVLPAERLADADAAAQHAGASVDDPWRVSALVGTAEQGEAIAATAHRGPSPASPRARRGHRGGGRDGRRHRAAGPAVARRVRAVRRDPGRARSGPAAGGPGVGGIVREDPGRRRHAGSVPDDGAGRTVPRAGAGRGRADEGHGRTASRGARRVPADLRARQRQGHHARLREHGAGGDAADCGQD